MAAISYTTFSRTLSSMTMYEPRINISKTFVPNVPINNIPALVQRMAWYRSGDKTLPDLMMVSLLAHICVIRPL